MAPVVLQALPLDLAFQVALVVLALPELLREWAKVALGSRGRCLAWGHLGTLGPDLRLPLIGW